MTTDQKTYTTLENEIFFQENQSLVSQNQDLMQQGEEALPRVKKPKKKPKRFAWAFFLFFMFMGVAFTATTELPFGVLAGLAFGFLSFVHPIHDKMLSLLGGKDHVKKLQAWEDAENA